MPLVRLVYPLDPRLYSFWYSWAAEAQSSLHEKYTSTIGSNHIRWRQLHQDDCNIRAKPMPTSAVCSTMVSHDKPFA
jgi:hypothetical protein